MTKKDRVTINVSVKDHVFELTIGEAEELYESLRKVFDIKGHIAGFHNRAGLYNGLFGRDDLLSGCDKLLS